MTTHIIGWIAAHGILAVFLVMAVDAVLPVGGELTMLFAGALAGGAVSNHHVTVLGTSVASGVPAFAVLVAAGALGYLAGAIVGYEAGRRGGHELIERHGRRLHLGPARFARAERWFERHGGAAVFLGRLTPLVRSFVSIPAGVLRIARPTYVVLTLAASLIWCLAFAGAGWALGGRWETVHHAFKYADVAVVAAAIVLGLLLLTRTRRTEAA
jgi:membrane protein DedA with SNARE-associated domain